MLINLLIEIFWILQKVTKHTNKVRDDVEAGVPKQNGLKLTMPTISGSVAVSERMSTDDGTPSTTNTDLSKSNACEDSVLDYAYDNLAMTPSPDTSQSRSKRESSLWDLLKKVRFREPLFKKTCIIPIIEERVSNTDPICGPENPTTSNNCNNTIQNLEKKSLLKLVSNWEQKIYFDIKFF